MGGDLSQMATTTHHLSSNIEIQRRENDLVLPGRGIYIVDDYPLCESRRIRWKGSTIYAA